MTIRSGSFGFDMHLGDLRLILTFIAFAYVAVYFFIPATPGNAPHAHPLGWWGWFDQGKYLLSANAFAQLDFSPDKHFYPPLYSLVGAIFLKWSSGHPYFVLNLLAMLWFVYVFIRYSDQYIPRWGSVALLLGTTILSYTIFENYVIPWTSTLSVALLATGFLGLVWLREVRSGTRARVSGLQAFFVATCLGLLVPTRPGDAVVGGVIGLGLLLAYWQTYRVSIERVPRVSQFLLLTAAGSILGPLLFFGFNSYVFGSLSGSYMQVAGANGFFPADLPEKFFSIWLDGFALYGESKTGLTERYPWLYLSLAGLAWVIIRGDLLLRTVALAIILLFVLYLPYGDLLPNGIWRYKNIHYFKWTFPFLALFAVLLVKDVWSTLRQRAKWVTPTLVLIGLPLLLLSLRLVIDVAPVTTRTVNNQTNISFDLPGKPIDFVDFKGITGGFPDVYLGEHRLFLDGHELKRVRDYRLLPMDLGMRLLFIRPVAGHSVEFIPDQRLVRHAGPLGAQLGTYRFAFGALKPFRQHTQHQIVIDYRLGELIEFSQQGNGGLYTTQGWSGPEAWGRWSINEAATIEMRVVNVPNQALELEFNMGAFVNGAHPCQEVGIVVNKKEIARQKVCAGNGGEHPSPYKFKLNQELLRSDGIINIRLVTPDSISPKKLGMSSDDRVLGVGIRTLKLVPGH